MPADPLNRPAAATRALAMTPARAAMTRARAAMARARAAMAAVTLPPSLVLPASAFHQPRTSRAPVRCAAARPPQFVVPAIEGPGFRTPFSADPRAAAADAA